MKIVLTCGHPWSGYEITHGILARSGLAEALPSQRDGLEAQLFQDKLLRAYGVDSGVFGDVHQVVPGKVWEDLAVDLFRGNLDLDSWGWAAANSAWLLEFWKGFDPQVRFVLVYGSPQQAVVRKLRQAAASGGQLDTALAAWSERQAELLRFYYRNKGVCVLANVAAVTRAPDKFIEHVNRVLQVKLSYSDGDLELTEGAFSSLAAFVGRSLTADDGRAQETYLELEAAADFPMGSQGASGPEADSAWRDYVELVTRLDCAEDRLRRELVAVAQAERARAEADLALAEVYQESQKLRTELKDARDETGQVAEVCARETKKGAELQRERDDLRRRVEDLTGIGQELSAVRLAYDEQRVQLAAADAALARSRTLIGELEGQQEALTASLREVQQDVERGVLEGRGLQELEEKLATAKAELEGTRLALAETEARLVRQRAENAEVVRENEAVLLQLQQVQEELERYFLLCEELGESNGAVSNVNEPAVWGAMLPSEVRYDLRGEIEGDNWFEAEQDGRWAGPGAVSTLVVPALGKGHYEIELDVVDAMDPEILIGTEVSVNGELLDFVVDWNGYPTVGVASYTADTAPPDGKWRFAFGFPRLVSPAEHGSADQRFLAIRLSSVRIVAV